MGAPRTPEVAAEIGIYGTPAAGHGFIASTAAGAMFGTGEPTPGRSATEALWLGLEALRGAGIVASAATPIRVHCVFPAGPVMAEITSRRWPYFGELVWGPGPVYELSIEEILAAAEPEGPGICLCGESLAPTGECSEPGCVASPPRRG